MPTHRGSHHLNRRAETLIQQGEGEGDDLLTTWELAEWLGMSPLWLENGRRLGFGPAYIRTGLRRIRYRRSDVLAWLKKRTRQPGQTERSSAHKSKKKVTA
jgi:predicted DNA-binding transcriptional regulator AlpA